MSDHAVAPVAAPAHAAPAVVERPALDVAGLPVLVTGPRAPLWWGMVLLLAIESTVFASFATTYLYLRFHAPQWPPAGVEIPDLLLPTLNTGVLIASGAAMYWGDAGVRKGNVRQLLRGLGLAVALGVLFLGLKVVEYGDKAYRWDTHAYGSIVWTIVVFHSTHVASVLLKGIAVATLALRGHFTAERRLGVQINGLYWQFVVVVWVPLYVLLYWVPRL